MSVPIINILSQTLSIYMQGEYPELSQGEIDNVSRMALANLLNDEEFKEVMHKIISNTLQEYVDNRPEPEAEDTQTDETVKAIEHLKSLGYKVSSPVPKVILYDCVCGASRKKLYGTYDASMRGRVIRCMNCGLESPAAKYQYQAKKAWNDMITIKLMERRKNNEQRETE
jgi:hypothetical protein